MYNNCSSIQNQLPDPVILISMGLTSPYPRSFILYGAWLWFLSLHYLLFSGPQKMVWCGGKCQDLIVLRLI